MATIAACQELHRQWLTTLAAATGGRTFSTHESQWVWLPERRQLVLLYPQRISPAGIRPGLAEGARLGARSVSAWLNNAVGYTPLEAFGFRRGPQPQWMSAPVAAPRQFNASAAAVDPEPAEVSGPDAGELAVGRNRPRTAWHLTTRAEGSLTGRAWVFVPAAQEQPGTAAWMAGVFGLAVGPSSRRRGYGSALLSRAAVVAADAGAGQLVINAAPLGAELCTARGFELIGRGQQLTLALD